MMIISKCGLFLFFVIYLTSSLRATNIEDEMSITYATLKNVFTLKGIDRKLQIKIDQEEYDAVITAKFSWLLDSNIKPLVNQTFEIDPTQSLYLDTGWYAITSVQSPFPILVTGNVYDCVALILTNSKTKTIGMYHVYPKNKIQEIKLFIDDYIKESQEFNINSILVSGAISSNLTRCYEIIREKNVKITHCHIIKRIHFENDEIIFSPEVFNNENICEKPLDILPILKGLSLNVAIDSKTMNIALNFNVEEFIKIYIKDTDMLQKALYAQQLGIHVGFSSE